MAKLALSNNHTLTVNTYVENIFSIVLLYQADHNRISGVMVSVLDWSAVGRGFEPRSVQINDYNIGICCYSAKHLEERSKTSLLGIKILCPTDAIFQSAAKLFSQVQSGHHHHHLIEN